VRLDVRLDYGSKASQEERAARFQSLGRRLTLPVQLTLQPSVQFANVAFLERYVPSGLAEPVELPSAALPASSSNSGEGELQVCKPRLSEACLVLHRSIGHFAHLTE
jgi:hypothetical protein